MHGHCHQCDYNLRLHKGRSCPECGAMVDDYKNERTAALRHLHRSFLRFAAVGLVPLGVAFLSRVISGEFSMRQGAMIFLGVSWLAITAIAWWMAWLETP